MSGTLCPFSWIQVTEAPGCLAGLFGAKAQLVWRAQPCMRHECKLWDSSQNDCGLIVRNQAPTTTPATPGEPIKPVVTPRPVRPDSPTSSNTSSGERVTSPRPLYAKPDQSSSIIYNVLPTHKITILDRLEGFTKVRIRIGFDSELEGYMLSDDIPDSKQSL